MGTRSELRGADSVASESADHIEIIVDGEPTRLCRVEPEHWSEDARATILEQLPAIEGRAGSRQSTPDDVRKLSHWLLRLCPQVRRQLADASNTQPPLLALLCRWQLLEERIEKALRGLAADHDVSLKPGFRAAADAIESHLRHIALPKGDEKWMTLHAAWKAHVEPAGLCGCRSYQGFHRRVKNENVIEWRAQGRNTLVARNDVMKWVDETTTTERKMSAANVTSIARRMSRK